MVASVQPFIEITRHADQVFKLIDEVDAIHHAAIRRASYDIAGQSVAWMRLRLTTGRRTGRVYSYPFKRFHRASAPGEFPAKLTGRLSRSIDSSVRSDSEIEVGIRNTFYSTFLEFGTRKMLRRPFIEPTSNQFANDFAIRLMQYSRTALSKGRGTRL